MIGGSDLASEESSIDVVEIVRQPYQVLGRGDHVVLIGAVGVESVGSNPIDAQVSLATNAVEALHAGNAVVNNGTLADGPTAHIWTDLDDVAAGFVAWHKPLGRIVVGQLELVAMEIAAADGSRFHLQEYLPRSRLGLWPVGYYGLALSQ